MAAARTPRCERIRESPAICVPRPASGPCHALLLPAATCRVVIQAAWLVWVLATGVRKPDVILVQSPPAIPTLLVAVAAARLRGARLVVDWHNLGWAVLALALGPRHPIVALARWYERVLGRLADAHLCVSSALAGALSRWGMAPPIAVLRDRPATRFAPLDSSARLATRRRLAETLGLGERAPAIIVSPTSWTRDEDFELLLEAVRRAEALVAGRRFPDVLILLTGRGARRAAFEARATALPGRRFHVRTAWLEPDDYPGALAAGDVGLCLHRSASGLDLPMKIADMHGAGLPVCALDYEPCLDEMLRHGDTGLRLADAETLANQWVALLATFPTRPPSWTACARTSRRPEGRRGARAGSARLVLCAWGATQYVLDDVHRTPADRVAPVLVPTLGIALAVVLGLQDRNLWRFAVQVTAVAAGLAFVVAMAVARLGLRALAAPRAALLGCATAAVAIGALVFSLAAPDLTARILADLQRFRPGHTGFTVTEVRPLLLMTGSLSLLVPWTVFGPAFFVGLAALGWLAWRAARTAQPGLVLLVVWSASMYAATLGQNRFGYYLSLNLALLTGWACGAALAWGWSPPRPWRSRADARRGPERFHGRLARWPAARRAVAVTAVVVVVFAPSALIAWPIAATSSGLGDGYRASLAWLRDNTPDPFHDANYYYARYRPGLTERPAYTVMAWWDYGYEIIRLGRRVPVANPTQAGAEIAGRFFTATDEVEAARVLEEAAARYVIAHAEVPILPRGPVLQGKFETLVAWAGKDIGRFWEVFQARDARGQLGPVTLFHPEYYSTLAVRLYVYGGAGATPHDSTYVITYVERPSPGVGVRAREIVESRRFKTYEAAAAYLDRAGHDGRTIVGSDPRQTPVPIEPLRRLRLLYDAPGAPSAVRIFESMR
jgi:beta-1,4-mannosyltransferase